MEEERNDLIFKVFYVVYFSVVELECVDDVLYELIEPVVYLLVVDLVPLVSIGALTVL